VRGVGRACFDSAKAAVRARRLGRGNASAVLECECESVRVGTYPSRWRSDTARPGGGVSVGEIVQIKNEESPYVRRVRQNRYFGHFDSITLRALLCIAPTLS